MNKKFFSVIAIFAVFCGILAMVQVTTAAPKGGTPKYSCSDTDGGNVITVFGTVSGYYNKVWYSNSDYCVDAGNILEYYCSGVYKQSQQQSCGTDFYGNAYCSGNSVYKDFTDYYCSGGACSSSSTPVLQENCDSYDGYVGGNYCLNGSVYRDYKDYYCSSGACSSTTSPVLQETCQYGCIYGACLQHPNSCSDTDSGIDYLIQGTVSGYNYDYPYSHTDSCNGTVLLEYYCIGSSYTGYWYNCQDNMTTTCSDGACV